MQPAKKLMLKKETLTELTTDQLRVVLGGAVRDNTNSCSCTSCGCSCEQGTCLVATLTDSISETTGRLVIVGC